jgi:hypothetical protein
LLWVRLPVAVVLVASPLPISCRNPLDKTSQTAPKPEQQIGIFCLSHHSPLAGN